MVENCCAAKENKSFDSKANAYCNFAILRSRNQELAVTTKIQAQHSVLHGYEVVLYYYGIRILESANVVRICL